MQGKPLTAANRGFGFREKYRGLQQHRETPVSQQLDFINSNFAAVPAKISTLEAVRALPDQVVWLASDIGKDVNGSVIPVDGKNA